jgi:hypothetical protein
VHLCAQCVDQMFVCVCVCLCAVCLNDTGTFTPFVHVCFSKCVLYTCVLHMCMSVWSHLCTHN